VFLDHLEGSLLAGIRGDEPRRILAAADDPNRPDGPLPAFLSLRRQPAVNNTFLAVCRFDTADDLPVFGNVSEAFIRRSGSSCE
jgi:hypothetical protein